MKFKLFTDGGARGNPGPSGIGGILYKNDKILDSFSERFNGIFFSCSSAFLPFNSKYGFNLYKHLNS